MEEGESSEYIIKNIYYINNLSIVKENFFHLFLLLQITTNPLRLRGNFWKRRVHTLQRQDPWFGSGTRNPISNPPEDHEK